MKKIKVDQDLCIGCGACMQIAGDAFGYSSEGTSELKKEVVEGYEKDILMAVEACPTGAIKIEDCGNESQNECSCEHCNCESCDSEDDCEYQEGA